MSLDYAIVFASSLALSLLLTPLVRKAMLKLGVIDSSGEDRWNQRHVALMGGIAMFISFGLVTLLRIELSREKIAVLLGGGAVFALGVLDDRFGTRPKFKFAAQITIALGVAYFGAASKIWPYNWIDICITVFWIVGLTNALNLLDNMDGLASGIAIIASMALLGLSLRKGESGIALLCLGLAGSCLGFLKYNFSPAKIFMGDCGSMFLGYMLAALAILGGWQRRSPMFGAFLPPVLILGVAIFDTTLVTVLRLKNRRWPWQGGSDHASHRLVSILGGSEREAVLVLYGVGVLAGVLGLVTAELSSLMAILAAGVFFLGMTIFGIRLARVECYWEESEPAKRSFIYSSRSAQRDRALFRSKGGEM